MSISVRTTEILEKAFNKKTNSINVITEVENEIVNGNVFILSTLFELETETVRNLGAETPANQDIRLSSIQISADINYIKLEVYEDVTFTGDAEVTLLNANRQSTNASVGKLYSTFTVEPSGGTLIDVYATLGGQAVPAASFGSTQQGREFLILKRNKKYLFKYTNMDSGTANVLGKAAFIQTDLTD